MSTRALIRQFITTTDEFRKKIGESGAIETIVNAMKTLIDNPRVCEAGCVVLWNILSNGKFVPPKG